MELADATEISIKSMDAKVQYRNVYVYDWVDKFATLSIYTPTHKATYRHRDVKTEDTLKRKTKKTKYIYPPSRASSDM